MPLYPFANGTGHNVTGDDNALTHLAFVGSEVFYTASGAGGNGSFGTIDLTTFVTTRIYSNVPAAHGMTLDCFTGDLMLFGDSHVTQIDPATKAIVSDLDLSGMGLNLDQGTSDGLGHLFAASNTGHLLFLDLSNTGLVGDPANFVAAPFLDTFIDDIAPECGLGSQPNCPLTQGYWKNHEESWPLSSLVLGDETYTQAELLDLLETPPGNGKKADASLILAHQLIAAKLNVANNGADSPLIQPVIDAADALLAPLAGKLPYQIDVKTSLGQEMVDLAGQLDDYNNGVLSPSCQKEDGTSDSAIAPEGTTSLL